MIQPDGPRKLSTQAPHPTLQQDHPIAPSSIRGKSTLISLGSHSLSYAILGDLANWWDAYPVPARAPAPYNDISTWGIVPVWGLAAVHEVDLTLVPDEEVQGDWVEASSQRAGLMALYNRYIVSSLDLKSREVSNLQRLGWEAAVRPLWAYGYLIADYVFSPDPEARPPTHPSGDATSTPWTTSDVDLAGAIVVTSQASVSALPNALHGLMPQFPTKVDWTEGIESVTGKAPDKLAILDFGSRDGGVEGLLSLIDNTPALKSREVVVISIGYQQKVGSRAALQEHRTALYFSALNERWASWLENRESIVPDLRLVWGTGVAGARGAEGCWGLLCRGEVEPQVALVYWG
ncbi:uncharacterized protein BDV17DRAFT_283768 [Aspergillus undulatus]|uniref:uncharacterized protein n=1 Tax=Aspergillus undulatus TaxID=1810928 RepID=UPI003CCE4166